MRTTALASNWPSRRFVWTLAVAAGVSMACNLGAATTQVPEATAPPPTAAPAIGQAPSLGELAKAAVQVLALASEAGDRVPVWSGSGSIVSPEGLILTNAHVIDNRGREYDELGIAVTDRTDQAPRLAFLAEVAAVDYELDLAVVRITTDLDGLRAEPGFPYVLLGDSEGVEIGDPIRILGYPGIGGETITFTEGAISGFTSERGVDGRAWLKTDATIAGGNSGGMGLNADGELVAVPTALGSGAEEGGLADCRQLVDTNRDGVVDDMDTCVPLGGFINALRPVSLALPLIEAARQGEAYVRGDVPPPEPAAGFDTTSTFLSNIVFSEGVTADELPLGLWYALPAGVIDVCAFWDYEGMADGMSWSAFWFVDGVLSEGGSTVGDTWSGGPTGNWWVCIHNDDGLADGLYELVLEVEGELQRDDSVFVGGNRQVIDLELENSLGTDICYAFLSPAEAQNWGQDRLGADDVVGPGERRTIPIATGEYDMRLLDCDGAVVHEAFGLSLRKSRTYTVVAD